MFFVYPIRQADSTGPFHVTNERSPTRGFGPISGRAGQREPRHRRAAELAYCHVITGRRYWQRTRPQQEERINNQPPESILSRHPGQFVERLCKYLPMLLWSRSPDLSLHRPSCLALIAPHLLFSLGVPLLTPETNQYRSSYFIFFCPPSTLSLPLLPSSWPNQDPFFSLWIIWNVHFRLDTMREVISLNGMFGLPSVAGVDAGLDCPSCSDCRTRFD